MDTKDVKIAKEAMEQQIAGILQEYSEITGTLVVALDPYYSKSCDGYTVYADIQL